MKFIDTPAFDELVNSPSELLMMVQLHQLMDGLISDLIEEQLVEKHHLELRRIPCAVKIELAAALGLLKNTGRATLLQINTLRNKFTHEPTASITEKDARDLYNATTEEFRAITKRTYADFETPRDCVGEIFVLTVFLLDRSLEHLRDEKLYGIAVIEEAESMLAQRPRPAPPGAATKRIDERFKKLKEENAR